MAVSERECRLAPLSFLLTKTGFCFLFSCFSGCISVTLAKMQSSQNSCVLLDTVGVVFPEQRFLFMILVFTCLCHCTASSWEVLYFVPLLHLNELPKILQLSIQFYTCANYIEITTTNVANLGVFYFHPSPEQPPCTNQGRWFPWVPWRCFRPCRNWDCTIHLQAEPDGNISFWRTIEWQLMRRLQEKSNKCLQTTSVSLRKAI